MIQDCSSPLAQETFHLQWDITNACNLSCAYCPLKQEETEERVSKETLLETAQEITSMPYKDFTFTFSGGEPTLHPAFMELVHSLYKHQTHIILNTNGRRSTSYFQKLFENAPEQRMEIHLLAHAGRIEIEHIKDIVTTALSRKQYCRVTIIDEQKYSSEAQKLYANLSILQQENFFPLSIETPAALKKGNLSEPSPNHAWVAPAAPVAMLQGTALEEQSWWTPSAKTIFTPQTETPPVASRLPTALEWLAGEMLVSPEMMRKDLQQGMCLALQRSGVFDVAWYLEQYPDVAASGWDPVRHYVLHGAGEEREPAPWFSTKYYLATNPDVSKEGVNPFYHYVFYGWQEGRAPHRPNEKAERLAAHAGGLKKGKRFSEAVEIYAQAIAAADTKEPTYFWHKAQGQCHMEIGQWDKAEDSFKKALEIRSDKADLYADLGRCLHRQGKWWQEIDALEQALALNARKAAWWYELGCAREIMERWDGAAEAYQKAIELDGQWAEWHYRLGYVQECNSLPHLSRKAYAAAIARDTQLNAKEYGIGVFHEKRGYWPEAVCAHEAYLREHLPGSAGLHAKLAVAYHRCYDFEKAAMANLNVLAVTAADPKKEEKARSDAFYRLGIVHERMNKLEQAAQAYACTLEIQYNAYRCYRQGYVLAQLGRYEEACAVYLKLFQPKISPSEQIETTVENTPSKELENGATPDLATPSLADELTQVLTQEAVNHYTALLAEDATRLEWYFLLGSYQEKLGDMEGAAASFAAGMARQSDHWPEGWYRLGKALTAAGHFAEACEAFANVEILRRPYWVDRSFYKKNLWFKRRADYVEYSELLPIQEKTVLYESLHGNAVGDNPSALFYHMLQGDYADWMHVWSLENLDSIPQHLKKFPNVIFIKRESDVYLRYLATAKICINDTTFPEYFIRRKEQIYLNTWHGTPIKYMGKDIIEEPLSYHNASRNFLHCTHFIHSNKYTQCIMETTYNIENIYSGISAITGYPKNDYILNTDNKKKNELKTLLNISKEKKIILYAPTWRGLAFNDKNINIEIDFITDVLETCTLFSEYIVLFRAHQALERKWKNKPYCHIAPQSIATSDILSITDILITDYSSICFDFMATGRPIIFYCHDIEEYRATRGLYFSPQELSGYFCRDIKELKDALQNISKWKIDKKYNECQKKYCAHDDGQAAKRVIDLLQDIPSPKKSDGKKNILFYIDFLKNGIGMAGLTLCNALDKNKYNIFILISVSLAQNNTDVMDMLHKLDSQCYIIPSNRTMNMTIEDRSVQLRFASRKFFINKNEKSIYEKIYTREWKRLFGEVQFDAVIDFTGYAAHQTEVFAYSGCKNKIIYLHSDMLREKECRFPYLKRIFCNYHLFHKVISVSDGINTVNKDNLANLFEIEKEKFVALPNIQRPEYIHKAAKEALESQDAVLFEPGITVFITLGRLSPEKNQDMLIEAFALLHKKYSDIRLLILGQGPLWHKLNVKIHNLELDKSAFLLGFRENPYALLSRADCFVLSSLYEGQPVVFFEALALNIPIIATDIPTSREVLADGKYGLLVEKSVEGIATGMESFLLGNRKLPNFDFPTYQNNALQSFENLFISSLPDNEFSDNLFSKDEICIFLNKIDVFDLEKFDIFKRIIYSGCKLGMFNLEFSRLFFSKKIDNNVLQRSIEFCLDNIDFIFNHTSGDVKFKIFFLIIWRYIFKIDDKELQCNYLKRVYSFFKNNI